MLLLLLYKSVHNKLHILDTLGLTFELFILVAGFHLNLLSWMGRPEPNSDNRGRILLHLLRSFDVSFFIEVCDTIGTCTFASKKPVPYKVSLLLLSPMQLATHKNAIGVAVGASLGHTVCTSLAVVGGSMLASKISQRTVATIGGVLFLGFSVSSYFYPPLWWKGTRNRSHLDGMVVLSCLMSCRKKRCDFPAGCWSKHRWRNNPDRNSTPRVAGFV